MPSSRRSRATGTTVRDPAELLDVVVDYVALALVLVPADRFTSGPAQVGEWVDPAPD